MTDELDPIDSNLEGQNTERPKFLKVLCILTFIGSGLGILGAIMNLTVSTPEVNYETLVQTSERMGSILPPYEDYIYWSGWTNITSLISSLLGLAGGLLMWNMKRIGFIVYLPSWILPIGLMFFSMPHMVDSFTAGLVPAIYAVQIIFMAAFVIMYAVNLKHLK